MGYSGWTHLDFKEILEKTANYFKVHLETGEKIWIPRPKVAYPKDYKAGDKNGCISVKDEWWEKLMEEEREAVLEEGD